MTTQKDGFLQTNQSFNFNQTANGFGKGGISSSKFSDWQKDHMYKSSYAQFHSKDSIEPRVSSIPKYGGYVPYLHPENVHGKSYTPISKDCFSNQKLAKNTFGLSTNGFNVSNEAFIDRSKLASTGKYGKATLQSPHPSWAQGPTNSTNHDSFRNPNDQLNPTYRQTDKFLQTQKNNTRASGYATNNESLNSLKWAGNGGALRRTEYRDRFNEGLGFHRDTFQSKERKLRSTEMNYKYN